MKKLCALFLALFLCLGSAAWAEGGVNVEIIKIDGESVVVFTPEETMLRAREMARYNASDLSFTLPAVLTLIEEEAFAGIAAEKVMVAENVVAIEGRAFADCPKLREIIIPASVLTVDDTALEGCADVTVYGVTGSEAQRFAEANGFRFVDPDTPANEPDGNIKLPPVELPFVPKK